MALSPGKPGELIEHWLRRNLEAFDARLDRLEEAVNHNAERLQSTLETNELWDGS